MSKESFHKLLRSLSVKIGLRAFPLVLPSLAWLIFFLLLPISIMVVFSFSDLAPYTLTINRFPTVQHYTRLFEMSFIVGVFFRTIALTCAVTGLSVVLAYIAAYYISFRVKRYKYLFIFLFWAPFLTSYMLILFSWKVILGPSGILNSFLMYIGLIGEPIRMFMYGPFGVLIALVHIWVPWLVLPIYVSLEKIDRSLLEAARDLGASSFQTFLKVIFPLSLPGVYVAILFVFIPTIGEYITPTVVGGIGGVMLGNLIQSFFIEGQWWSGASALTFIMLVLVVTFFIIISKKIGFEKLMESL